MVMALHGYGPTWLWPCMVMALYGYGSDSYGPTKLGLARRHREERRRRRLELGADALALGPRVAEAV